MALIADTSGIVTLLDETDRDHERVRKAVEAERGALIVPDFVIPEVDYLALKLFGITIEREFLENVATGGFSREPISDADFTRALEIIDRYREHRIGIVDATIVAVAERLDVPRVLTLDRRHFETLRFKDRRAFDIVP